MRFTRHAARGPLAALTALACFSADAAYQLFDESKDPTADFRPGHLLPSPQQLALARNLGASRVNWNRFGTVNSMIRHGGYLAQGYPGTEVEAARAFIRDNAALFRLSPASANDLELVNDGVMPGSKGHAVLFRQSFGGLPSAHDGLIMVAVVEGKVYYVSSSSAGEQPAPGPAVLSPVQAWLKAAADVNRFVPHYNVGAIRDRTADLGWFMFDVAGFSHTQRARLVAMPIPEGGVRQAWETIVLDVQGGATTAYVHFVDAGNGDILRRESRVNYQANDPPPQSFSGALPDDGTCAAKHEFEVPGDMGTLIASVTAANTANDIYVDIYFVHPEHGPVVVAHGDTGTSPEAATYQPEGRVPPGTYQVQVCSYAQAEPLPPTDYSGVFQMSTQGGTAVPFPPLWSWFGSTPELEFSGADVRTLGCWVKTETAPAGCYELQNLASRAPWDVVIASGKPSNTTNGNNAKAATSWGSPLTPAEPYQPVSANREYIYPFENIWNSSGPNGLGCDPSEIHAGGIDVDAAVTNMFASHNRMHDWSYFLGFTERNYNLQVSNFGLTQPSRENDPENGNVQAGALDGGYPAFQGRNNANQITLQDGVAGITNQYLWQPLGGLIYPPCADGNFDMLIIGHEYTHAITNRMIGGPDSSYSGMHGPAMGEAWSDLAAIEYQLEYGFVQPGFDPAAMAGYVLGSPDKGLRNYNVTNNPLNFSNYGYDVTGPQSHADSEIWGAAQWKLRELLVAKYNAQFPESDAQRQKDCADGKYYPEACPGNRRWIQLMLDAILLSQAAPSMLDVRDATLAADVARFGGANQFEIWHAFAESGMGVNAYAADGNDVTPIPNFESPLEVSAVLTITATAQDENDAPITNAKIYVGQHATRSRHLADTDPATVVDTTTEETTRATQNNASSFRIAPDTYDFIVEAPGYGQHRFTATLQPGTNTLSVSIPTNRASSLKGATVVTSARNANNVTAAPNVIDDTENTGAQIGDALLVNGVPVDDGLVEGAYAKVALSGGPYSVRRVHVSTAAGPNNGGRFTALRKFEIRVCNGTCANPDVMQDFTTVAYTSPDDAFPSDYLRPLQPQLNMREFEFPPVAATHVLLRVLTNQCTGNTNFHGDLDDDPANPTDCLTVDPPPVVDPLSQTVAPRVPPRSVVRLTEFQVFGSAIETDITNNALPVANAGPDGEIVEGRSYMLTGSGVDPELGPLAYRWTQIGGPTVQLGGTGADSTTPTFTAPQVAADTDLTFVLTVTDNVGQDSLVTDLSTVVITVLDAGGPPPTETVGRIGNTNVGALSSPGLLLIGLAGLMRRRRRN